MASSSSASAEVSADGSTPVSSAITNISIQDLKQPLIDAITTASESRPRVAETQFVTLEQLKELIQTTLDAASSTSEIKIVNEM